MSSTTDIQAKWQERKNNGLDLGAKVGTEQDAGWGGRCQVYQSGRIYWHPQVGVHEVHGGILTKYLQWGGPGNSAAVGGGRPFGFPKTDEELGPDGVTPVSKFEWGAICWVRGSGGGVPIYGAFYPWNQAMLGYPLTEPLPAPKGGKVVFTQKGCLFTIGPRPGIYNFVFKLPGFGKPELTTPSQLEVTGWFQSQIIAGEVWQELQQTHPNFMVDLWQSRFAIQAVKPTTQNLKPTVQLAVAVDHIQDVYNNGVVVHLKLKLAAGATMEDRTLYNIGLQLPSGVFYVLAPHSVYARTEWRNFRFIHATDMHVSRRCDQHHSKLISLGLTEGARAHNNYNEGLRDLIRHANRLHAAGSLDLIVATGDLVDYQYEDDDQSRGGGNFAYFQKILLGTAPSPTGTPVEELHTPIFVTLGNHDYRRAAYKLWCDVDLPAPFPNREVKQFAPHNLSESEVRALQGGKPTISTDAALAMVRVTPPAWGYDSSYIVRLGPRHRIVVINSRYDLGVLGSTWDAFVEDVFGGNEDEESFVAAEPNQVGFSSGDYALVSQALAEAGDEGIVVVGVHGPPLNIQGNEFNHYFRETEHPTADKKEILGFLIRQSSDYNHIGVTLAGNKIVAVDWDAAEHYYIRPRHPNWLNSLGQTFFMRGDVSDFLDRGTSHGAVDLFLKLCTGVGHTATRPVDLVLCGHGHNNVEYRIQWDPTGNEMRFFHDFYTENPSGYYGSRKAAVNFGQQRVMVSVKEGAPPNGTPTNLAQDSRWEGEEWRLDVPPYPRPLATATDIPAWWSQHRPLILQTGAVGPMEGQSNNRREPKKRMPDPSFQGYRLITVTDDKISAIHYIKAAR